MKKQEIRQLFKEKRKELTADQREEYSANIAAQFMNWYGNAEKHLSIFLPIERLLEIETRILMKYSEATFYLPVVREDRLAHVRLESMDQLKLSDWGILEPTYGEEVDPSTFDAVLIPLLACDQAGNRVGYGKGYYDGFLSDCREDCDFIGLSYFEPIEEVEDTHDGDIPLNYCITPNSVRSF